MNGRLSLAQLDQQREEILNGISTRNECWEIGNGPDDGFVLGSADLLRNVLGLVDEEYGWPITVDAGAPIDEFRPRHRGHPFIMRNQQLIAIAVSMDEYRDICTQLKNNNQPDDLHGDIPTSSIDEVEQDINEETDYFTSHQTKHPDEP